MVRNYERIPIEDQKRRGPKVDARMPTQEVQNQILNRLALKVPKKTISENYGVSLYIINKIAKKDEEARNQPNQQE